MTESGQICVRLPAAVMGKIQGLMQNKRMNQTDAAMEIIANGLKWEMRHYSDTPLSLHFLERLNPVGILQLYAEFLDAVCTSLKSKGKLGNRHRFKIVPENSKYYEKDFKSYVILREGEFFTEDGEIAFKVKS